MLSVLTYAVSFICQYNLLRFGWVWESMSVFYIYIYIFKVFIYLFIYLALGGLSCRLRVGCLLRHVGSLAAACRLLVACGI